MVRGVEIASDVADLPRTVVTRQVANGVAVRMAILFLLLGGERRAPWRCPPLPESRSRHPRRDRASGPAGPARLDVAVRGGTVVALDERVDAPRGAPVLDAGGCLVGPGLVDLHTHLRQPGREEAETIETGARAAALGGYTAVVAMPNTEPADRLGRRRRRGAGARRRVHSPRWRWPGPSPWGGPGRRWPRWPSWPPSG